MLCRFLSCRNQGHTVSFKSRTVLLMRQAVHLPHITRVAKQPALWKHIQLHHKYKCHIVQQINWSYETLESLYSSKSTCLCTNTTGWSTEGSWTSCCALCSIRAVDWWICDVNSQPAGGLSELFTAEKFMDRGEYFLFFCVLTLCPSSKFLWETSA